MDGQHLLKVALVTLLLGAAFGESAGVPSGNGMAHRSHIMAHKSSYMKHKAEALRLIVKHEGFRGTPYPDPGNPAQMNIGYGTMAPKGVIRISKTDAERLVLGKLADVERELSEFFGDRWAAFSDGQRAGLLCGAYNIRNFRKLESVRALRAGNRDLFVRLYAQNIRGGGRILGGLVARRQEELLPFYSNRVDTQKTSL